MFRKKHIDDKIYDFLSGNLPEAERVNVENHLASCKRCSEEQTNIEQAVKVLNAEKIGFPDLPEQYWESYWKALELRLKQRPSPSSAIREFLELLKPRQPETIFTPKVAYGVIGFALGAVVTLGILSPYLSKKSQPEVAQPMTGQGEVQSQATESASLDSATREITEPLIKFFQKAKAFLIAVKNLDESKETAIDLSAEQETSKKLAAECRNLKRLPLDPREQQLLSELDVVLVQLSKVKDQSDSLKLDLVKEGIESNNLLMRIRVHELAQEVRLLQATQKGSNQSESF